MPIRGPREYSPGMSEPKKRPRQARHSPEPMVRVAMQLPVALVAELDESATADLRARQHQVAVLLREALAARARRERRRAHP